MVVIKEFPSRSFESRVDALKELVTNKKTLIAQKKGIIKEADAINCYKIDNGSDVSVSKAESAAVVKADTDTIIVKAVSNAVNYYDSHGDVSLPSSWNRTAKNTKNGLHLQEHEMRFDKIISDEVSFSVENFTWKELGYNFEGETEALVMTSKVQKEDNPYMFGKYVRGKVKNHSAGLRYVSISLAINSGEEWAKEEKAVWDKYYDSIANKEDVDEAGYFWAIHEQKIIETSAVPRGSNPATPTISVESADSTSTKEEDSFDDTPRGETKSFINTNFF